MVIDRFKALIRHNRPGIHDEALETTGAEAEQALLALRSESWLTRSDAARALGTISEFSDEHISALVFVMSNDEEPSVRVVAAVSLGIRGYGSEHAFPTLIKMVDDSPTWREAISALERIGVSRKGVISILIKALSNPEKRAAAAKALGSMGRSAKVAVPTLEAILGYSAESTCAIVRRAIRKIEGKPAFDQVTNPKLRTITQVERLNRASHPKSSD